jgi:hypothetical protein
VPEEGSPAYLPARAVADFAGESSSASEQSDASLYVRFIRAIDAEDDRPDGADPFRGRGLDLDEYVSRLDSDSLSEVTEVEAG